MSLKERFELLNIDWEANPKYKKLVEIDERELKIRNIISNGYNNKEFELPISIRILDEVYDRPLTAGFKPVNQEVEGGSYEDVFLLSLIYSKDSNITYEEYQDEIYKVFDDSYFSKEHKRKHPFDADMCYNKMTEEIWKMFSVFILGKVDELCDAIINNREIDDDFCNRVFASQGISDINGLNGKPMLKSAIEIARKENNINHARKVKKVNMGVLASVFIIALELDYVGVNNKAITDDLKYACKFLYEEDFSLTEKDFKEMYKKHN